MTAALQSDFDAYMNDLDMEIESRFGPIGLGLWLGKVDDEALQAVLLAAQKI